MSGKNAYVAALLGRDPHQKETEQYREAERQPDHHCGPPVSVATQPTLFVAMARNSIVETLDTDPDRVCCEARSDDRLRVE